MVERSGVSAARHAVDWRRSSRGISSSSARRMRSSSSYIAHARMQQHFRPTVTDPGYDVVTENRYFVAGDGSRVGGAVVLGERLEVGRRSPAVSAAAARESAVAAAAAPLRRRLSLPAGGHASASTATTATSSRFEPVRRGRRALPRHGVDRREDVRARARAGGPGRPCRRRSSRTKKRSATRRSLVGNRPVFLFSGLTARQIVLIAGRNLLVEKSVDVQRFPRQHRGVRARARVGPRERSRDVSRNRSRPALLREGERRARRQRPPDESREGDGDRASRSIRRTRFRCRCSASTT